MAPRVSHDELRLAANTIRGLAIDGVQAANSGHPGMPMGMADVAAVLWLKYLEHNPAQPDWPDRDRFVLSAGHGSMLLYSLLHLAGYALPLEELRRFRQWKSLTPGHPEHGHTPGVETTTGPLGQGCGNAVGMALAERMLAARFNREGRALVDHYTYVIAGDGDLMEGISHEVFSLAGHLGLNKLIVFYDSNRITIEGSTALACSDDVKRRFQGYRWNVIEIDAHDVEQIDKAIRKARRSAERPTLVVCRSHIGYGSPNKQDTHGCHGEPLGEDEVRATKRQLGLPEDEAFHVPDAVRALFAARLRSLKRRAAQWKRALDALPADAAALWERHMTAAQPDTLSAALPGFDPAKPIATRSASGKVIQALAGALPQFVGGSADLAPSNKTRIEDGGSVAPGAFAGRNLHFGVREHAMGAVMNGILLHGGFRVFGGTFLVFADYCRPAIRLAALMGLPAVYVFTHDSFCVGEDGPTHQPIEQLASLRVIPNLVCLRPADATETAAAWAIALARRDGPTALLLTRQNLPVLDRAVYPPAEQVARGGYVLWQNGDGAPDVCLLASGSEVEIALQAARALARNALAVRVVSMPSWELFDAQPADYRAAVIPDACPAKLAIEAGCPLGWARYVGSGGKTIGMTRFGASAPYTELLQHFGFTPDAVVAAVRAMRGQG
jgi:transketolase